VPEFALYAAVVLAAIITAGSPRKPSENRNKFSGT
jgi:hypothetical protein